MNIEIDDDLMEDDECLVIDASVRGSVPTGNLDARRIIERRVELRSLRDLLDDPEFDDNLD